MLRENKLNLVLRFCFFALLGFSVIGLNGCLVARLVFPPDEPDDPGFGQQAEFVEFKDGQPLIRTGLALRIGVTASGNSAVQDVMKEVDLNGQILMPLIGAVKCEGFTIIELQENLTEAYRKYFIDPQVTVNFIYQPGMKSPWGTVLMTGEVGKFGPVDMPSTRDLTVTRALMMAGGATPMANKKRVLVWRREKDGSLKRFEVDIDAIGKKGQQELDITLRPGDVVFVPESWY